MVRVLLVSLLVFSVWASETTPSEKEGRCPNGYFFVIAGGALPCLLSSTDKFYNECSRGAMSHPLCKSMDKPTSAP